MVGDRHIHSTDGMNPGSNLSHPGLDCPSTPQPEDHDDQESKWHKYEDSDQELLDIGSQELDLDLNLLPPCSIRGPKRKYACPPPLPMKKRKVSSGQWKEVLNRLKAERSLALYNQQQELALIETNLDQHFDVDDDDSRSLHRFTAIELTVFTILYDGGYICHWNPDYRHVTNILISKQKWFNRNVPGMVYVEKTDMHFKIHANTGLPIEERQPCHCKALAQDEMDTVLPQYIFKPSPCVTTWMYFPIVNSKNSVVESLTETD